MGTGPVQRLAEIKVIPVFGAFLFFPLDHFGCDHGGMSERVTYGVTCRFVLVDPFGDNVPCPLQGFFGVFHFPLDKTLDACG